MRDPEDLARELEKVWDVARRANTYFHFHGNMNAALHMAADVRPAPLATAVSNMCADLERLIDELKEPDATTL